MPFKIMDDFYTKEESSQWHAKTKSMYLFSNAFTDSLIMKDGKMLDHPPLNQLPFLFGL
jgi:hypothetical protein